MSSGSSNGCSRSEGSVDARLPATNHLIRGVEGTFAVGRLIYRGRYGAVYEVLRKRDGRRFAAKLEVCDEHSHGLDNDYLVLRQAEKAHKPHFAALLDRGKIDAHFKFVVMTLLGDNLATKRAAFVENRFSFSTALRLGLLALDALQSLHSLGFTHRDVKPTNFALGPVPDRVELYIIDFGLCRPHVHRRTDETKPPRENVPFRGTTRYASLAAHRHDEQSPKDDVESWLYMLVEMLTSTLPWDEPTVVTPSSSSPGKPDKSLVLAGKEAVRAGEPQNAFFKQCPKAELKRVLEHVDGLKYGETVDYEMIKQQLGQALTRHGFGWQDEWDWQQQPA